MSRSRPLLVRAAWAVALAAGVTAAPAQTPPETPATAPQAIDTHSTFRAEANLVVIPVSVTDAMNRFVLGLRKEDFTLTDDGVEQNVAHFSGEDIPLSIGLAFDISASMTDKMTTSREAAMMLLRSLNRGDEVFLVEFNDTANLSVGLTDRPDPVQDALQKAQASGQTALLDGVKAALGEMQRAKNPRKAIVVVSDGGDNNSKYTAAQIEALVRAADVEIYAMGVFDPLASMALRPEEVSGPRLLSEIATETGGRAFAASLPGDLPSVATRIAIELRNQYVLGYYPKDQVRDGKYHNVDVKIAQPAGVPQIKAHWRQGYYAPSEN